MSRANSCARWSTASSWTTNPDPNPNPNPNPNPPNPQPPNPDPNQVEERVEQDNHRKVSRRCQAERGQRQRMMDQAGHYGGEERARMHEQANSFPLDWCEEKDRLDALK